MIKKLKDLSEAEMNNAIEENFLSLLPYNKKWSRAAVFDKEDLFCSLGFQEYCKLGQYLWE